MKQKVLDMIMDLEQSMERIKETKPEYYKLRTYIKFADQVEILYELLRKL